MCTMNSTIYDCIQMENSARIRLIFDTRGIVHRSGNSATKIDIIRSAGFSARIQLDGLNMYKTDTSYKGKHIGTAFYVRKGFRKKVYFNPEIIIYYLCLICELRGRLQTILEKLTPF